MNQNSVKDVHYPNFMRRIMTGVGFNVTPPYGLTIRGYLFLIISIFFSFQTLNSMLKQWDNMTLRFLSIRHFTVTAIITSVFIEYAIRPKHIHVLLNMSEEDFFDYKIKGTEKVQNLIKKTSDEMNFGSTMFFRLMMTEYVVITLLPLVYLVFIFSVKYLNLFYIPDERFHPQHLPLPLVFGSGIPNFETYGVVYVLQLVYLLGGHLFSYGFNAVCACTAHRTTGDMKLFNAMLSYYDKLFTDFNKAPKETDAHSKEYSMRIAFRELVAHHDFIYRKCKLYVDLTGITLNISNDVLMFLICLDIFEFTKETDNALKMTAILQIIPAFGILLIHCNKGQNLINEGETMHQTIAEFSWIDKPKWCKDSILLMLTRNEARTEINPLGLYVLDLKNFAKVLNGAYSYYNVFSRFEQS